MPTLSDNSFRFSPDKKLVGEKGLYFHQDSWDGTRSLRAAVLLSRRVGSCLADQRFVKGTEESHLQGDNGIHLHGDAKTAFLDQLDFEEWNIRNAEPQAKVGHWPSEKTIQQSRAEIDKLLGLDWLAEEQRAWAELDKKIRNSQADWTRIPIQSFPFLAMVIDAEGKRHQIGKAAIWRQEDDSLKLFYETPHFQKIEPVSLAA